MEHLDRFFDLAAGLVCISALALNIQALDLPD